jgi:hypothetical protein
VGADQSAQVTSSEFSSHVVPKAHAALQLACGADGKYGSR